ncbi:MAG: hypothetical protein HDT13_10785 [Butyrivibrio sp.]|nr:hypothetical protein [Butyrivibrio sp.]
MKKSLKLLLAVFIVSAIFLNGIGLNQVLAAPTGTVNVTSSVSSVIAGENITVNISVSANSNILGGSFNFVYDNNLFEYVSTTGPIRTTNPAGVILFEWAAMSPEEMTASKSIDVVFKAKTVGTGKFSVQPDHFLTAEAGEDEPEEIAMTCSDASVQVMAVGSDDATLASLQVAEAGISPEFAKWTMNYTCYVANSVTAVNIAAVASQGGKVEVGGNFSNLAVGGNNITVTSYAPNGKTMTYTINVVRLEPPTEPPATEAPTTTEPETTLAPIEGSVTVSGVKYTIDSGYSSDIIPAGFDASIVSYEGNDVLAAVSTKYNATLFYLMNDKGEGSFFLYDSKNKSFFPYKAVDSGSHRYILADSANADRQPAGCTTGQITINGVTFDALISDDNGDFAYFYAINDKGVSGWYCYDKGENTVQRMFTVDMGDKPGETTSPEDTKDGDGQTQTEDGRLSSLENANNNLKKDYSDLERTRNLIIAIASVLLVVMLVIIVVMAAHKSEKKRAIDLDVEDLADEEDAIEIADAETAAVDEADEDYETEDEPAEENEPYIEPEPAAADEYEAEADTESEAEETEEIEPEISDEVREEQPDSELAEEQPEPVPADVETEAEVKEPEKTEPAPEDIKISDADIEAFEKEAAAITETIAGDVTNVIEEENKEIEPEIIDLTVEDGAQTADGTQSGAVKGSDDGIEIIDADDEGEDDFFL